MVRLLFTALGSPSFSTITRAIRNGYLKLWPGLTITNITKRIQYNDATMKGHRDRVQKKIRSTKKDLGEDNIEQEIKRHWACATVEPSEKIYTDQTGAFPTISSKGFRYVFILYHYDTNSILAEPIWNRTGGEIFRAHLDTHQLYTCWTMKSQQELKTLMKNKEFACN